jgi:hypothetical protein
MTPARMGELITIAAALIGGGLWLGSLDSRVQAGEAQLTEVVKEVKTTPTQVAVLQTQMASVQETVKDQQAKQGDKLDTILEEVRRR